MNFTTFEKQYSKCTKEQILHYFFDSKITIENLQENYGELEKRNVELEEENHKLEEKIKQLERELEAEEDKNEKIQKDILNPLKKSLSCLLDDIYG